MLALTRRTAENVIITVGEIHITVTVISAHGTVKLGFSAPQHVKIDREEIWIDKNRERTDEAKSRT